MLGGGAGILSSLAVPLLAITTPWAVANAVVTVVSTLLSTELHARYTFTQGRSAGWREHWQSAGSAAAAYLATSTAVYLLHQVQPSPGILTEQSVYLSACALAGLGRFVILRRCVFTTRRTHSAQPARPQGPVAVPALATA
jgi:putative flippase GtrA